jgi:hypothetical protein
MKLTKKQILRIDKEIVLNDNKRIVEVDVSHKEEGWSLNEICFNIYCVDPDYHIIWQVKEIKTKPPFGGRDPFCYLGQKEGEIIADRFSGFEYRINPDTGEATQIGFHK